MPEELTLALAGDVMTGRGVDQILPRPGDPGLAERGIRDARSYVRLAEEVNGPIPRQVDFGWPWGDALSISDYSAADVRLVNLETSITARGEPEPGKPVCYRMNPDNVECLTTAGIDVGVLANNHVLDFGRAGLSDTLATLADAGITAVGAGSTVAEAAKPAVVPVGDARVLVFAFGAVSSGIPPEWAATADRPGIGLLPDLSADTADAVLGAIGSARRPGDVVVVSLHWGTNWGYDVPSEHVRFAHRLADGGVDIVHGHSSHHARPIEFRRGRLVLYGCGDLIDDYEGIGGHERYRDDLRPLYLATVRPGEETLVRLRIAPLRVRRMRLHRAGPADTEHLRTVLDHISRPFGTRITSHPNQMLAAGPSGPADQGKSAEEAP